MYDPSLVFQRTHSGRSEIHEKKSGLTQSERLVLIMVDGVTHYQGVRGKLPVLTDQRFERAISTLLQKELISEVFMPVAGINPEEVERSVIDRFLQQDPLDPVTIIMVPEDERLDVHPEPAPTPPSLTEEQGIVAPSTVMVAPPALDEHDAREADEIGRQARARERGRVKPERPQTTEPREERQAKPARRMPGEGAPLAYWLMAVAGAFLIGYALATASV